MNEITIDDLLAQVASYNPTEVEIVKKAYEFAEASHCGQKRASGHDYITHPLNVAYILALMHADRDTLCAGILHDILEDTCVTKEELATTFNPTIALLVDGVTKTSNTDYSSKNRLYIANQRKIIMGITEDVRIIIIKLADRLHNMRTLQYKSLEKQKEKAIETIEIFVPLAYYIGAYSLKTELEDLSLKYLKPEVYEDVKEKMAIESSNSQDCLEEMLTNIKHILRDQNIPNEVRIRTKHIYEVYKKLSQGHQLNDIHDLHTLKIMVDDIKDCYVTLGLVHSQYHPINDKFKDYICNPKTNMYQSLHSTVFGPKDKIVQAQIRTSDMDQIDSFGLTAYWNINKGLARDMMQTDLKQKFQFFKSLNQMNLLCPDDKEFVSQVKKEIFTENVYVYTSKGDTIELPLGSTIVDFAYKIHSDIGDKMVGAMVNGEMVRLDYQLKTDDRISILINNNVDNRQNNWDEIAHTTYALRKIRELKNS